MKKTKLMLTRAALMSLFVMLFSQAWATDDPTPKFDLKDAVITLTNPYTGAHVDLNNMDYATDPDVDDGTTVDNRLKMSYTGLPLMPEITIMAKKGDDMVMVPNEYLDIWDGSNDGSTTTDGPERLWGLTGTISSNTIVGDLDYTQITTRPRRNWPRVVISVKEDYKDFFTDASFGDATSRYYIVKFFEITKRKVVIGLNSNLSRPYNGQKLNVSDFCKDPVLQEELYYWYDKDTDPQVFIDPYGLEMFKLGGFQAGLRNQRQVNVGTNTIEITDAALADMRVYHRSLAKSSRYNYVFEKDENGHYPHLENPQWAHSTGNTFYNNMWNSYRFSDQVYNFEFEFETREVECEITPLPVTITVQGEGYIPATDTEEESWTTIGYDGKTHSVKGWTATAFYAEGETKGELVDFFNPAKDITYNGEGNIVEGSDPGQYRTTMKEEEFKPSTNYKVEDFVLKQGGFDITDIVVTINGTRKTFTYDGKPHKAKGYTVDINTDSYSVNDFTFNGEEALAESLDEGITPMLLTAEMFENTNPTFEGKVNFVVNDGWVWIKYFEADLGDDGISVPAVDESTPAVTNAEMINKIVKDYGHFAKVTLKGRTLYKDGSWNTICLPFNVDLTEENCPLAGADVREAVSAALDGNQVTLMFTKDDDPAIDFMEAGKPYLIKWASGDDLTDPVFNGAEFDKKLKDQTKDFVTEVGDGQTLTFKGTYTPVEFKEEDNSSVMLVGANNTIYTPAQNAYVNAQRAYFVFGTAEGEEATEAPALVLSFGGTTMVKNLLTDKVMNEYFDLSGRRIVGQPTEKGIYIVNGKKVIVK